MVTTNSDCHHFFLNPHLQVSGLHCNLVNAQKGEPVTHTHSYVFFWEKSHSCNRKNGTVLKHFSATSPGQAGRTVKLWDSFQAERTDPSFMLHSKLGYIEHTVGNSLERSSEDKQIELQKFTIYTLHLNFLKFHKTMHEETWFMQRGNFVHTISVLVLLENHLEVAGTVFSTLLSWLKD